jgi:hypothetical protein
MGMGANPVTDAVYYGERAYGTSNAYIPVGAATTVIKSAGPGILGVIAICTAGTTGNLTFYDSATGATGNILFVVPGTTAQPTALIGTVFTLRIPFIYGLAVVAPASAAAVSLSYL